MAELRVFPSDAPVPGMHVLVVDDDRVTNRVLQRRLTALGYEVDGVATGEEAIAWLADDLPDLIFLDVSMPGISGLEVLAWVRARELDVAVIMITAFGSEEVAIDALRRGADDYLRKPVAPGEFEAVLQRTVARVGLRRHNAALQRQLDEKRRQLEVEVARAAAVQAELLPHAVPALAGFELAARCIPARDVGGDFYDWQMPTPGLLTLTLCDVMGKGMPAALMMATVRAVMRAVVRTSAPAVALQYIVAALDADLGRAEQFVTLFLAQLNIETHELTFVDAGHGHVLLRRSDGRVEALQPRGLPLGVLPDERYSEGRIVMKADDALIVYSDGLVDARPDLALTPHALAAQLRGSASAVDTVRRLVDLAALSGPPPDDLTIVVLWCQKMP